MANRCYDKGASSTWACKGVIKVDKAYIVEVKDGWWLIGLLEEQEEDKYYHLSSADTLPEILEALENFDDVMAFSDVYLVMR